MFTADKWFGLAILEGTVYNIKWLFCLNMYFQTLLLVLSLIQMARLQGSKIFKAASSLNFQEDMIGSISMLLCGKQPDINSTKMTLSLRSPRQVVNNKSISIMGNSSGKCCNKVLFKAKLSQSTCVLFVYLHFRFTVLCVVAGNGQS